MGYALGMPHLFPIDVSAAAGSQATARPVTHRTMAAIRVVAASLAVFAGACGSRGGSGDAGSGAGASAAGGSGAGGNSPGAGGAGVGGGGGFGGTGVGGAAGSGMDAGASDAAEDRPVDAAAATMTQVLAILQDPRSPPMVPGCLFCHDGTPGIPDYRTRALSRATLIGVASESCPPGIRVVAGNAETSVLVNKLRAGSGFGLATVCGDPQISAPMPRGNFRLTLDELHTIENWINAGARDD